MNRNDDRNFNFPCPTIPFGGSCLFACLIPSCVGVLSWLLSLASTVFLLVSCRLTVPSCLFPLPSFLWPSASCVLALAAFLLPLVSFLLPHVSCLFPRAASLWRVALCLLLKRHWLMIPHSPNPDPNECFSCLCYS